MLYTSGDMIKHLIEYTQTVPILPWTSLFSLHHAAPQIEKRIFNTHSMKQPDLYYFDDIKMTSQAWSNFEWRMRTAGEYSL